DPSGERWERPSKPDTPSPGRFRKGPTMEWVVLITVIVILLTVDLLLHRGNHDPTPKRALIESAAWVACGLGFAVVVLGWFRGQASSEYLSGYGITAPRRVDNM